jgi:hypothetical protein
MNELVLNGLVKRRAQLAGDIENTHEALRKMVLDLASLDATIVQFDPDFQVKRCPELPGVFRRSFRSHRHFSSRTPLNFFLAGAFF